MASGRTPFAARFTAGGFRTLCAALLPIPACWCQWLLWPYLKPFPALLFYPAVFIGARLGGKVSGIAATLLSAVLIRFFFLSPEFSFKVDDPYHLLALLIFTFIGILFSLADEWLRRGGSLEEPLRQAADERMQQLDREVTRLHESSEHLGAALTALLNAENRDPSDLLLPQDHLGSAPPPTNDELLAQVAELLKERRSREEELRSSSMAALNLMEDALMARDRAERLALQREAGEEALRASEERLQLALAAALMGVWEWDVAADALLWSPECLQILGTPGLGRTLDSLAEVVHPADAPLVLGSLRDAARRCSVFAEEYRVVRPGGEVRWVCTFGRPSLGAAGETARMVGTVQDITERKRGEEARENTVELLRICSSAGSLRGLLEELASFFRKVTGVEQVAVRLKARGEFPYYDASRGFPEAFLLDDHGLRPGSGAPSAAKKVHDGCICGSVLLGRTDLPGICRTAGGSFWTAGMSELLRAEEELLARRCDDCFTRGLESLALVPLRYREESFGFFQFGDRLGGRLTPQMVAELEELVAYVAVALAKLESDQALKESGRFYEQIINSACEGLIVLGADLRYLVWNPYMERLSGVSAERVLGRHPLELFPFLEEKGVLKRFRASLGGEISPPVELTVSSPDTARSGWLSETCAPLRDVRGEIVGVIAVVRDITQEKQLEEQLRHAQKMEAIGQLAGGVAHDFNNILMVIYGYCNLMRMQMKEGAPFRDEVDQVLAAAERAANLTKSLLAFSRKQVMLPKPVDLNVLIVQVERFLTRIIGEDIALSSALAHFPVMVFADSGQLEQVLMNLAANARDAMPNGGLLTIETGVCDIEEAFVHAHGHGVPGRYAFLSVQDTGVGMESDTCARIFDPFFTTKGVGKGTGLGLSIVYGVVKQHGGYITVSSTPGGGSSFLVHLPLLSEEHVADQLVPAAAAERQGSETVLVAEDDAAIRGFVEKILTRFGYRVMLARNGAEAVRSCSELPIDLVIMDMIMPVQGGMEASLQIREVRPGMKILFMSGYSPDLLHSKGVVAGRHDILMKPIEPMELMRKVREVLDRA